MKVLLLTPVHNEYVARKSKKLCGIPVTQGQASWVKAILSLGHEIDVFIYSSSVIIPHGIHIRIMYFLEKYFPIFTGRVRRRLEKFYKYNPDVIIRSIIFEKKANAFKPDIICISGGLTCILPAFIKRVKDKYHAKVLLFSGVNPIYSITPVERNLVKSAIIDYVIENDSGYADEWRKKGVNSFVLPISSVDPDLHKKVILSSKEKKQYSCDVSFVGSITPDRVQKLKSLTKYNFKFWGDIKPGVSIPADLAPYYQGLANSETMIKIFNASKIVVNLQPKDMVSGGNMRTFEIPATGSFMLTDKIDEKWFKEIRPVIFSSISDAKSKIDYYLENDSERIDHAKKLKKYMLQNHTYKIHFHRLFQLIKNEKQSL